LWAKRSGPPLSPGSAACWAMPRHAGSRLRSGTSSVRAGQAAAKTSNNEMHLVSGASMVATPYAKLKVSDPVLAATLLGCAAAYLLWTREASPTQRAQLCFWASWGIAVLALVSPLCNLGVALFSARVAQHVLLTTGGTFAGAGRYPGDGGAARGPAPRPPSLKLGRGDVSFSWICVCGCDVGLECGAAQAANAIRCSTVRLARRDTTLARKGRSAGQIKLGLTSKRNMGPPQLAASSVKKISNR
jgi:hypothetical protein